MQKLDFDPYDFSKKEVEGVQVYYKNIPAAPCLNIRVVFNVGAFNDPVGKEGLSHFFEHLVFNGAPGLEDKKAVNEWSKKYALNTYNAWTSFYNTNFWLKCLPEKFDAVLEGMKSMIFYSYLREADVEHEKKVIIQEAWGVFQNEKYLAYMKEVAGNLFAGHEHARFMSALGWPETVTTVTQQDVLDFHKTHYGASNFFVVLTGAVEDKHLSSVEKFLSGLPKVNPPKRTIGTIAPPKEKKVVKRADEIGEMKEQVEISMMRAGAEIPYQRSEISSLSGKLLYEILHERLRVEHSLCYGVQAGTVRDNTYSQPYMNVKTEEKNIDLVLKEFENVLREIKENEHTEKFDTARQVYLDQIRSSEFLSQAVADTAVKEVTRYGHTVSLQEQLDLVEKVSYADVVAYLAWAFDPEYLHTEIILPSKK